MMSKKSIFSSSPDIYKTAYLNWRMSERDIPENLYQMGQAFAKGAMALLDVCLEDNSDHRADTLIFPIFYSIDQCIEVSIKGILCNLDILEECEPSNYVTHDISQLLSQMKARIKKHDVTTKGLEKHLEPVQSYIDELFQYIGQSAGKPQMDFARYPIDSEGNSFFYVVSQGNVTVDLVKLKEQLQEIINSLDDLHLKYSAERDVMNECLALMAAVEE